MSCVNGAIDPSPTHMAMLNYSQHRGRRTGCDTNKVSALLSPWTKIVSDSCLVDAVD